MTDETLFSDALAIPDPVARATFLARACPDPVQRQRVAELLAAAGGTNPLDRPPADLARTGAYEPGTVDTGPTAAVGDRVGPYKLLEKIGEGGMGEVWVADQLEPIKRRVALKLIKPGMDSRSVLGRFEAERQALAMMDHPNIAKVLDAGQAADGRPYFVMELVKGTPITEFCDARKLTPKQRLELFVPVCQAIQHAHMKGIIHRDIKPGNVLVALHDETPVPKVIDFGVAKAVGQQLTEKTIYTGFGALVGTPAYMAPEQATFNQLDVDTRADVYALGVLLYELLAGSPPIEKERLKLAALDEVLRIVRDEEPPRPSARLSTSQAKASIAATRGSEPAKLSALMKGEIDWIVMKALEKDRTRRYDTATGFAADITRYLSGEQVQAVPPSLGYRLRKAYRRNRAAVLIATSFSAILVAATLVSVTFGVRAGEAERQAKADRDAAVTAQGEADAERAATLKANEELARTTELQRKTRYAAEMNLLQAAYTAKDFPRVKRLLFAQVPKPGEPDLRGPEWHYWHRKFHGHDSEFRITLPQSELVPGRFPAALVAVAPNGATIAVVTEGSANGLSVQFWSASDGTKLREIELASNTSSPARIQSAPTFSRDSERLLVRHFVPSFAPPAPNRADQMANERGWIVNVSSGEVRDVHHLLRTSLRERTAFAPDLRAVRHTQFDTEKGTATHTFRDTAGDKELGRINTGPFDLPTLCPDREHVLTVAQQPFGPGARMKAGGRKPGTYAYWKLGGDEPLWEWSEDPQASAPEEIRIDGKHFHRWVAVGDTAYWKTNDLATGEPVSSIPIASASDLGAGWMESIAVTNREGTRLAYQTKSGFTVRDLEESNAPSPFDDAVPLHYDLEMFEGTSHGLAFTADGRVVSVTTFTRPRTGLPGAAIVRTWTPPKFGWNRDRAPTVAAVSVDHKRFAFVTHAPDAGAPNALVKRIAVLDADGAPVFASDVPGSRYPSNLPDLVAHHSVGFSDDGRYLAFVQAQRRGNPGTPGRPAVVWDLQSKREVARLVCEPGTYYQLQSALSSPFDATGARLVLGHARYQPADRPSVPGLASITAARVFELPSGKPLCDVKMPDGARFWALAIQGDELLGTQASNVRVTKNECTVWDARTGESRGTRELPSRIARFVAPPEWTERGGRAIRQPAPAAGMPPTTIEIWNSAKRSPTDRPSCVIEVDHVMRAKLSPNGSRLLVAIGGLSAPREVLYCTATGRELVTLPPPSRSQWLRGDDFAAWSLDGNEFWFGVNPDDKPYGHDFRPRQEPKK